MSFQKTKIVATIGPASVEADVLQKLILSGLDVARLNFSHGDHAWHARAIENIRHAAAQTGRQIAVMADLQGPRVRTLVEKPLEIKAGQSIRIIGSNERRLPQSGEETVLGLDSIETVEALREGQRIFIEDGLLQLKVREIFGQGVFAEVVCGGTIRNHKGVNLPDTDVPLPALTDKDKKDLKFALAQGVDFVALSFVRGVDDVKNLRARIASAASTGSRRPQIIVKIERPEAIENLPAIISATDAVMVARGDLATETGPAGVTVLQKDIVAMSLTGGKPVIVATQMLASMETNPRPTRSEIADVTNAVVDHADAVMLSGETANGRYPVETVRMMRDIIAETEISPYDDTALSDTPPVVDGRWGIVLHQARKILEEIRRRSVVNVICFEDEEMVRALSHYRQDIGLVFLTADERLCRQAALLWGVEPRLLDNKDKIETPDRLKEYFGSNETLALIRGKKLDFIN